MKKLIKRSQKEKTNKGITLIALIITIIVLLILVGVSIASLTGENGLLKKALYARERTIETQIKEEIELAILEIQVEEREKGHKVTLSTLVDEKEQGLLISKLEEITGKLSSNQITGEYKGYEYTINDKLEVTIGGKVTGISITYDLDNKEYTNKDVILTVHATSTNGEITKIEEASGLDKNQEGAYIITQNGNYEFIVTDASGKTKSRIITISNIDKEKPKDFTPTITDIKSTSFIIHANVEDNNKGSGIGNIEYYVNGTKDGESDQGSYKIQNLNASTTYNIYVIAYDKAGNDKQSAQIEVQTGEGDYATLTLNGIVPPKEGYASNALPYEAFDNDFSTLFTSNRQPSFTNYIRIDPNCWGKYLTIYCQAVNNDRGYVRFVKEIGVKAEDLPMGKIANLSGTAMATLSAKSILIPENALYVTCFNGTDAFSEKLYVYEIWCSDESLSGNQYSNDNKP